MSTKKLLVKNMHHKMPYLKEEDIAESVDFITTYLSDSLKSHHQIEIRGFGSMSVRTRKYAGTDKKYYAIYYRMSKSVLTTLNNSNSAKMVMQEV